MGQYSNRGGQFWAAHLSRVLIDFLLARDMALKVAHATDRPPIAVQNGAAELGIRWHCCYTLKSSQQFTTQLIHITCMTHLTHDGHTTTTHFGWYFFCFWHCRFHHHQSFDTACFSAQQFCTTVVQSYSRTIVQSIASSSFFPSRRLSRSKWRTQNHLQFLQLFRTRFCIIQCSLGWRLLLHWVVCTCLPN